jgi:hypothetical protein
VSDPWIKSKVMQALDKVEEAKDESKPLSKEEFVDDLALTSIARLWDVIYLIVKYQDNQLTRQKLMRWLAEIIPPDLFVRSLSWRSCLVDSVEKKV